MVITYIERDMNIPLVYMCVFVGGLIEWVIAKDINTFEFNERSRSNRRLNIHFENISLKLGNRNRCLFNGNFSIAILILSYIFLCERI